MFTAEAVKSITLSLGADKCGISGTGRFDAAPPGFHPLDVYSKCKSVVVFLKQMPSDAILAEHPVVYSHTAYQIYQALDQIGLNLCSALGKHGIHGVPVPTDVPYLYWDEDTKRGMGIISLRHAARNAGLGILGRNTLLINNEYGNMVYIGAVLVDTEFLPDPVETGFSCPPHCDLCLDACPVRALDGLTVDQRLCRENSSLLHPRVWDIYTCNACRKVCLYRNGVG
ncbi:MAG: epoxyqueuosine reductase [Bacteroidota bacterium]